MRNLWLVVARASLGVMFANSGWGKIQNSEKFVSDFHGWGVPIADFTAPATAWAELLLGIALIVGLLTRFAAAGLVAVMAGAIFYSTISAASAASTTVMGFMSHFFYASEWLLVLVLLVIVAAGAGALSLDHLFKIDKKIVAATRR